MVLHEIFFKCLLSPSPPLPFYPLHQVFNDSIASESLSIIRDSACSLIMTPKIFFAAKLCINSPRYATLKSERKG